ncbi:MAG: cyclopropane-fatty-acyl-phospholipid synthase [Alphaproteobacteria bacterium]|nr:cyclopropane-fatty-acyl-phospholipid synthase [Alphaproteobacteria bacterium]
MLFQCLLKSVVRKGTLKLTTADGKTSVFGDGALQRIAIKLHRKSLEWSLGLYPDLKIGEAYTDGTLTIEEGDLYGFLFMLLSNYAETGDKSPFHWHEHLSPLIGKLGGFNPIRRARRNAAFHYDMPDQLYRFFLDPDRQYSCGYFTDIDNSLDQAQLDKKRHIASKLLLNRSGLKVLDIGSGWGGLGLYLAREAECRVKGITLSFNQYKISRDRAAVEGLGKSCDFALRDYRQEKDAYDRIVSVGMFEHVGKKNYDDYFAQIRRLLKPDGVCLIHSIGRFGEPRPVSAFIRKHIFPGADIPTLPEALKAAERAGLFVTDVEILRLHYAETLKRWIESLHLHRGEIINLFGDTLYRKWEFYFIGCEVSFRLGALMVFQMQLSKQLDALPLTRDYMHDWEQAHQAEGSLDHYVEDIAAVGAALRE